MVKIPSVDIERVNKLETATLALGWFWTPEAQLGLTDGIIKTRVGYAGGTKENPSYHNLGDHTEAIEVDFDPNIITYSEILDWYFSNPNTCRVSYSTQYDSIIFYRDENQKSIAVSKKEEYSEKYSIKLPVRVKAYEKFYLAENYHQKYYLQLVKDVFNEYKSIYPNLIDFTNSTATMMVNSYIKGRGTIDMLKKDINKLGLSDKGKHTLLEIVEGYGR